MYTRDEMKQTKEKSMAGQTNRREFTAGPALVQGPGRDSCATDKREVEIPALVALIHDRLEVLERGLAILNDRLQCVSAIVPAKGAKDAPERGARTEVGGALVRMIARIDSASASVEGMTGGLEI
jgi:hypothetical protein